jgi:hypothetical protein
VEAPARLRKGNTDLRVSLDAAQAMTAQPRALVDGRRCETGVLSKGRQTIGIPRPPSLVLRCRESIRRGSACQNNELAAVAQVLGEPNSDRRTA